MTSSPRGSVVGVVLAAGASRRAGGAKALAVLEGQSFVARTVAMLRDAGCSEVVVVVAAPHAASVMAAVGELASFVSNPAPERGMSTSLCLGLEAARERRAGAAMVALVDHPAVAPETARALIAAFHQGDAVLVRPRFGERRGHPYLLGASLFGALLDLPEGNDPRPVLRAAEPQLEVAVEDAAVLDDLDTAAAIRDAGGQLDGGA